MATFCQTCALSVTVRTLVVSLLTARSPHRECSSPKDHSDYIRSAAPPNAFHGDLLLRVFAPLRETLLFPLTTPSAAYAAEFPRCRRSHVRVAGPWRRESRHTFVPPVSGV